MIKKTKTTSTRKAKTPAQSVPVAVTNVTSEPTPRVGQISFELVKPDAKSVAVAGSFNDWKPETTPLAPAGNGRWVTGLQVAPGRHEYLFVVDGQWVTDPNARETVGNPFGGKNSVLTVVS